MVRKKSKAEFYAAAEAAFKRIQSNLPPETKEALNEYHDIMGLVYGLYDEDALEQRKKIRLQERKKAVKEVLWNSNPWVFIRRQWNDYRIGKVRIQSLHNLCWDDTSGGVRSRSPHQFIHGYVYCNEVDGDIAHSCLHGEGPHFIKVCVVKKDNNKKVFELLNDVVGPKPDRRA